MVAESAHGVCRVPAPATAPGISATLSDGDKVPPMHYRTYSRRIFCPFHGMLQIVDVESGVAESTDGLNWRLYVADESIVSHTGLSEVRYGSWHPVRGCSRSRVRGTSPTSLIEDVGGQLIKALQECAASVPFSPLDSFEHWLLDTAKGEPLALLESAMPSDLRVESSTPQWHPGAAARREFSSSAGSVDDLSEMISQTAGHSPRAIWVERCSDGSGKTTDGNQLPAHLFPALFLRPDWNSPAQAGLVRDFAAWQAPWLLQLDSIDRATREWLESAAWRRPQETNRVYRLFPVVQDKKGLTATRVRARLAGQSGDAELAEAFYPSLGD